MDTIVQYLQENIILVMFLIIGLGHLVGKVKLGSVALGSVTGILIVGILIGVLMPLNVPPIIKGLAFTLFLFVLGVSIGPGLIHMLTTRAALKYLVLGLSTAVFMVMSVFFVAKVFDLSNVVVAGLSSGAMSTSAVMAAAQSAIASGSIKLPAGMSVQQANDLVGSAYAITYLYGVFGLIILLKIAPSLVGKDIAVEAAKMESGANAKVDMVNRSAIPTSGETAGVGEGGAGGGVTVTGEVIGVGAEGLFSLQANPRTAAKTTEARTTSLGSMRHLPCMSRTHASDGRTAAFPPPPNRQQRRVVQRSTWNAEHWWTAVRACR